MSVVTATYLIIYTIKIIYRDVNVHERLRKKRSYQYIEIIWNDAHKT